ncbi:Scarecrow-like protein 9 [Dichanthelium oligosanthes]|uniref:Scarecrow-like protein 9 n=1 Tax=Dichanthelium oligosanthes TaxID=888268 RepID=A0A1E5V302_9POAL|nr:Scarecrow-like protein 9 [Dichanthelium oligosanthes]
MSPASSPSAFLDLPPTPHVYGSSSKDDDLVLPYIARMLMEEEEEEDMLVDRLSYYQHADHHQALLRAQQPFAHILSGASSDAGLGAWPYGSTVELSPLVSAAPGPCYSDDIDTLAATVLSQGNNVDTTLSFSLNAPSTDTVEPPSSFLPAESSCMDDLATTAFFKGMEEGSKFLPTDSKRADGTGRRKRLEGASEVEVEAAMRRSSKQMAAPQPESEEESAAREMMDKLMLTGYDACLADTNNTQDSRGAMDTAKTPPPPKGRSGSASPARHAVDLHTMLIRCAEAVSCHDRRGAADLLLQIRGHSSPTGDGMQRLAHYLADGLEARMAGTGNELYQSLVAKGTSTACILKAHQLFLGTCFFFPVQYPFSNTTIRNAAAGRKKLHIVHYGLGHGLQWPDLLRCLSCREGGPPEVRLTGVDNPLPGFHPARLIEETGRRLSACARQFGVPFKFRGIAAKSDAVHAEDLNIDADEVLVVNCFYHFRTLMDESVVVDRPNPRDLVLRTIKKMRPKVFIHGVFNGSHCAAYFMSRFRDALHHYTALFDMMDTIVARDNDMRLQVEQGIFARCAVNVIACEGADRVERSQSYKKWEARSQRAGLRLLPLDPEIVRMLTAKVKESHKYFVINEDHGWLLHGWKGRMLYALSTWTSDDDT